MTIKVFFNEATNVAWLVRIVRIGARYGLNNSLVHDQADPLVEFYDTRCEFTDYGQFVSRYYVKTLLEDASNNQLGANGRGPGLILDTGTPEWTLSADTMNRVRNWLLVYGTALA